MNVSELVGICISFFSVAVIKWPDKQHKEERAYFGSQF